MATKAEVYNGVARLLKERRFSDITTDDVPLRYELDNAYDAALRYMLEQGQWNFASRSTTTTTGASANRGFTNRHTKPTDFVRLISISSSSSYYPPLEDYDEDATYWYSNESAAYVTYVSDDATSGGLNLALWPETYSKAVQAYLAKEIAPHLNKDDGIIGRVTAEYEAALQAALAKDAVNRTHRVTSATTSGIFKSVLRTLGMRLLNNFDDAFVAKRVYDANGGGQQGQGQRAPTLPSFEAETESALRRLFDESYEDVLAYMLEQGQWNFASRSLSITTGSSAARGFDYSHPKPSDFVRLIAISSSSEYFPPLESYDEDATYWYADIGTIYLTYVSDDGSYGASITKWPRTFRKAFEAKMALELAPHLTKNADAIAKFAADAQMALRMAVAKDAINRTARVITPGTLAVYNGVIRKLGARLFSNFDDMLVGRRAAGLAGDGKGPGLPVYDAEMEAHLRRLLDESYDGAVGYVLEQAQWNFATRSTTLSSVGAAGRGFAGSHAKPADLVRLVAISTSSEFFPPLEAYDEDAASWYSDASTLYVTYVSDDASYGKNTTLWPNTFREAVESYLAKLIAPHLSKDEKALAYFEAAASDALRVSKAKDAINRTARVVSSDTLSVYNGAIRLLGARLFSNFDDMLVDRRAEGVPAGQGRARVYDAEMEAVIRRLLDEAYDGAVGHILELAQWNFATVSEEIAATVAAAPLGKGYIRKHAKPSNLVRLISISDSDSYYPPLEAYDEDADYWFTNDAAVYVTYVSDHADYGRNVAKWPNSFRRAVEAYLAKDVAPHLTKDEGIIAYFEKAYGEAVRASMAKDAINRVTKVLNARTLDIYNAVIRSLGGRLFANFDDKILGRRTADLRGDRQALPSYDVETETAMRRLLDEAWSPAVNYILEKAQWNFANRAESIASSEISSRGYSRRHDKPTDFVRLITIAANNSYYPPIENYDEDARYFFTNSTTIFIVYVSNDETYGLNTLRWPETFRKAVECYLTMELAPHFTKDQNELVRFKALYEQSLQEAIAKDAINRTVRVASSATLSIYNGALRLLGVRLTSSFDDRIIARRMIDADRRDAGKPASALVNDVEHEAMFRRLLDEAYDDAVTYLLEQGYWNFGMRSVAIEEETDVEPSFGYNYVFEKPDDYVRLAKIADNGTLWPTLDDYLDEGNYWHANVAPLYVQYVSNGASYGLDASLWPATFKRALEAYLALEIAPHVPSMSQSKMEAIRQQYRLALRDARSKDAMNQAAERPPPGRLTRARAGYYGFQRTQRREN